MTQPIVSRGTNSLSQTVGNYGKSKSFVVTAAKSALNTLPGQHTPKQLSRVTKGDAVPSDIEKLVNKAAKGRTPEVDEQVSKKITQLIETSNKNLSSARINLCELSRISHIHYENEKKKIFEILINLIEADAGEPSTSSDVVRMIKFLNEDLDPKEIEELGTDFRMLLAKTFCAAIELLLRHASKNIGAVSNDLKKISIKKLEKFKRLINDERRDILFFSDMSIEACKRIKTDLPKLLEIIQRASSLFEALMAGINKDGEAFVKGIQKTFEGLDQKIKEKWFDKLIIIREAVRGTDDKIKKVAIILCGFEAKELNDWQFYWGAIELLKDVIEKTDIKMVDVFETALLGKKDLKVPGVLRLIEFNHLSKRVGTAEKDNKALQAISRTICDILIVKFSKSKPGRQSLIKFYREIHEIEPFLKHVIPAKPNMHEAWCENLIPLIEKLFHEEFAKGEKDLEGLPPQVFAAKHNQIEKCKVLLKSGLDPLAINKDKDEMNVLHWAVQNGQLQFVRFLITEFKKLLNKTTKKGYTPLLLSAENGFINIWEDLLTAGANVHATVSDRSSSTNQKDIYRNFIHKRSEKGWTPLMIASNFKNWPMCRILLDAGANPLECDSGGMNALHLAAAKNHDEIVKGLALTKAHIINSKNKQGQTPLMVAAQQGCYHTCVEIINNTDADPLERDANDWTALEWAIHCRKHDIVQFFSTKQFIITSRNERKETALMFASKEGDVVSCQILLKQNADYSATNIDGWNAMHLASHHAQIMVMAFFMKFENIKQELINSRAKGEITPLMVAAGRSSKACTFLLKQGADPYLLDKRGYNAMHYAAANGKVNAIKTLFARDKTLVNSKVNNCFEHQHEATPLMFAARASLKACTVLMKCGANPFDTDRNCRTVMHYAASGGIKEVIKMFAAYYRFINVRENHDITPLMLAAETNVGACEVLLKAGADPSLKTVDICVSLQTIKHIFVHGWETNEKPGWNTMHFAARAGKLEIVKMLSKDYPKLVDAKTDEGQTPKMIAQENGYKDVVEFLDSECASRKSRLC